jgi:hypothetical protein
MGSNVIRCITGSTRNPNNAIEVAVPIDSFTPATFDGSTDVLRLRLLTRIGTNTDDTKCATGHGSAAGLRLYFDGINQASQFGAAIRSCSRSGSAHSRSRWFSSSTEGQRGRHTLSEAEKHRMPQHPTRHHAPAHDRSPRTHLPTQRAADGQSGRLGELRCACQSENVCRRALASPFRPNRVGALASV